MDLTDLWQQHKKFILAVAAALLLLLIGRGVLQAEYPVVDVRNAAGKIADSMKKLEEVPDATVRNLQSEVDALRARYVELVGAMRFKRDALFELPSGESNPRSYFFNKLGEAQGALVDAAEKQDIRVPEALGLKDTAPTDTEEIKRTLVALNVIQGVMVEAISAGVRRVDSIHIEDEQRARGKASSFVKELRVDVVIVGGERSLRTLLYGVIDGPARGKAPYLAIDKAHIKPVKGEEGMLELTLTLVALDIAKGEDGEAR